MNTLLWLNALCWIHLVKRTTNKFWTEYSKFVNIGIAILKLFYFSTNVCVLLDWAKWVSMLLSLMMRVFSYWRNMGYEIHISYLKSKYKYRMRGGREEACSVGLELEVWLEYEFEIFKIVNFVALPNERV